MFTQRVNIRLVLLLQWFMRSRRNHCRTWSNGIKEREDERMSDPKRIKHINFRVTDQEYREIEKAAAASGDESNNWCRKLALSAAREGPLFGKTGRLVYTELAILRFLIGHGFKLLFSRNEAEASAWTKLTTQADQRADAIVTELLSRRKQD
jgi:hypothetical protein